MHLNKAEILISFWAIAGLVACDVRPTQPDEFRVLEVVSVTTGGDPDTGYEITISNKIRQIIGPSANSRFNLDRGVYSVEISGIADNCQLSGSPQRSVDLRKNDRVKVEFEIACLATGLEIHTHTAGLDMPDWFTLSVAGLPFIQIGLNTTLAVTRLEPGQYTVQLVTTADNCGANGANAAIVEVKSRVVTPVEFNLNCVALARPEMIVYSRDTTAPTGSVIEMITPDGSGKRRIGPGSGAAWSPDGKRIAYSTVQCDLWYYYYYVCNGGLGLLDPEVGSSRLIANGDRSYNPSWSPAGDVLAVNRFEFNHNDIYLLKLDGFRTRLTIPGVVDAADPDWSPDGTRLAFTCIISGQATDICTVKLDGSGLTRLTTEPHGAYSPSWSRDGTRIAFTRITSDAQAVEVSVISASGGAVTKVVDGSNPSWSPDGTKILFNREDGLFTANADGTNIARLTSGRHFNAAWRRVK